MCWNDLRGACWPADPKLKDEFEQRVASDAKFAASPDERLNWFLQRSPWWDRRIGLYTGLESSIRFGDCLLPKPRAKKDKPDQLDPRFRTGTRRGPEANLEAGLTFFPYSIYPIDQRSPENPGGRAAPGRAAP